MARIVEIIKRFWDFLKRLFLNVVRRFNSKTESLGIVNDNDAGKRVFIPRLIEAGKVTDTTRTWGKWIPDQAETALPESNLSIQGIGFSGKSTFLFHDVLPAVANLKNDDGKPLAVSAIVIDSQIDGRRKDALEAMLEIRAKLHSCSPAIPTTHLDYALHSYATQVADQKILKLNLIKDFAGSSVARGGTTLGITAKGGKRLKDVVAAAYKEFNSQAKKDAIKGVESAFTELVNDPQRYIGSPQALLPIILSCMTNTISNDAIVHVLCSVCVVPAMGVAAKNIRKACERRSAGQLAEGEFLQKVAESVDSLLANEIVPVLVYFLIMDLATAHSRGRRILLAFDTAECLMGKLPSGWAYASPWAEALAQTPFAYTLFVGRELPDCLCGSDEGHRIDLSDGRLDRDEIKTICDSYGVGGNSTISNVYEISGGVPGIAAMLCSSLAMAPRGLSESAPALNKVQARNLSKNIGAERRGRTERAIREVVRVTTRDLSSIDRQALFKIAWFQSWQPDMVRTLMPESRSYPMALSVVDDLPYVSDVDLGTSGDAPVKQMHSVVRTSVQEVCDRQTIDYLSLQLAEQFLGNYNVTKYKPEALAALVLLEARRLSFVFEPHCEDDSGAVGAIERSSDYATCSNGFASFIDCYLQENGVLHA